MSSQTETSSLSALNVSIALECYSSQVSLKQKASGHSKKWHPGQPSYLIHRIVKPTHISLVVTGVQATDQTRALGDWKQTRAVDDRKLKV